MRTLSHPILPALGGLNRCYLPSFTTSCVAVQLGDDLFVMPTLDEPSTGEGPEGEAITVQPPAEHGLAKLVDMDFDAALQMHVPHLTAASIAKCTCVPVMLTSANGPMPCKMWLRTAAAACGFSAEKDAV